MTNATQDRIFAEEITRRATQADEAISALKTEMTKTDDLFHILQWNASSAVRQNVLGRLWAAVKQDFEQQIENPDVGPVEVLTHHRDQVVQSLINNRVVENSTNPINNALTQVKADAYSTFVRDADAMLTWLAKS